MKYDFDYLKDLFKKDPDKFKEVTADIINDGINNAREDKRTVLRAKQWRLEQELNKIVSPIARMNRMAVIFWEGVSEFNRVCSDDTLADLKQPKYSKVTSIFKK